MYILRKPLPMLGGGVIAYRADIPMSVIDVDARVYSPRKASLHRYKAKVFRWWITAWFYNLAFQGEIEKIHVTL